LVGAKLTENTDRIIEFDVLAEDPIHRVTLALEDLRQGKMIILVDDEDRENEGDIVIAAEKVTASDINFMAVHARGLICLSITGAQVERLGLSMMTAQNQTPYNTAFTVSIEAREGVTTGISAADRARTCQVACSPKAMSRDIVTPGHMFPLRARDGGVLVRVGQTEGSVDLARLAGLQPAGVICEIMNPDGTMARMPQLMAFGREHTIRIVTVADIIKYRMRSERVVQRHEEGTVEVPGLGSWCTRLYRGVNTGGLHMAIFKGQLNGEATVVRVQGAPPAWSFIGAGVGKSAEQARKALEAIHAAGAGALVLMNLDGVNEASVRWAFSQDFGGESGPRKLVQADALRDLGTGCQILLDLGLRDLRLLTNSTRSIVGIEAYGLQIVERLSLNGGTKATQS